MGQQMMFSEPARQWTEALPIGNGLMGAMVFGGTRREHLQVNEDSVWSGGPRYRVNPDAKGTFTQVGDLLRRGDVEGAQDLAAMGLFSPVPDARHYETLGDVFIDIAPSQAEGNNDAQHVKRPAQPTRYHRTLDLDEAMCRITYDDANGTHNRRCFASHPDQVMVYAIEEPHPANIRVTLERRSPERSKVIWHCDGIERLDDSTIRLYGTNGSTNYGTDAEGNGISYVLTARVTGVDTGCRIRVIGRTIVVNGTSRATVLITARTTFRSTDPTRWCLDALDAATAQSVEELESRHTTDMARFAHRATLHLADADPVLEAMDTPARLARLRRGEQDTGLIELYCAFARYLLIASSREDSLPANLQGIWCADHDSPWGSKYTININTEMNYWFAEAMGLQDLHMPLLEHIRRMRPNGERVACDIYGSRGFVCHHNTDIWGDCAPTDVWMPATLWPMGAAWLCLHIVDHYRHTHDTAFAHTYLPTVHGAVRFFLDVMVRDHDGAWVVPVSLSPENTYRTPNGGAGNLCRGSAMDTQILRELFDGYLELAEAVGGDADFDEQVRNRIDALPPIRVGDGGCLLEWDREYDEAEPGHRHFSPLFAVYPAAQIRPDTTPELADAALALLRRRIAHGSGREGWSRAWSAILFARLGHAEEAWDGMTRLLTESAFDNLFNADHLGTAGTPFQIDGNFGGLTAVLEMLVHDYGDEAAVLPALPAELDSGSLTGLRLRAGCSLNVTWTHGALVSASLEGLRDGEVTLILPDGKGLSVQFCAGQRIDVTL